MQRITITVEDGFLDEIDRIMATRGYENRSEAIRDLARAGLREAAASKVSDGDAIGALLYVYEHDRRELSQRLASTFHEHHDLSLASLHVHLSHETCLEVNLLQGPGADVSHLADHVIAERGVHYGQLVTVPVTVGVDKHSHGARQRRHTHTHVRGA